MRPSSPRFFASERSTPSPVGERQMFPVQTTRTRIFFDMAPSAFPGHAHQPIAQRLELVAQARGALELEVLRRLEHLLLHLADALVELLLGERVVLRLFLGGPARFLGT